MLVANNVGTFDRGQDTDLVECILLLFLGEIGHFDFFECINLWIDNSLNFVDTGVGSLSKFTDDNKILQGHGIKTEELIYFISFTMKE